MRKLKAALIWTLSLTWGLIMTLIGLVVALFMLLTFHKPKKFHYFIYFEFGKSWGGVSFGPIFIKCKNSTKSLMQHESGHSIQNILLGPIFPFLIAIPSAIRYWYRELVYKVNNKKYQRLPDYDAIWFEGWATKIGEKHFK